MIKVTGIPYRVGMRVYSPFHSCGGEIVRFNVVEEDGGRMHIHVSMDDGNTRPFDMDGFFVLHNHDKPEWQLQIILDEPVHYKGSDGLLNGVREGLKEAERKDREATREELIRDGILKATPDFKKPTEAEQKWLGERTYSLAGKKPEIKFTYGLSWELSGEAGLKMKAAADKLWDELAAILAEDTSKGPVKKEMSYGEKVAATKAEMDEILARLRSREGWIEHLEAKIAFYRDYLAKIDIRLEDIEAKVNGVQPKVSAGGWVTGIDPAYKINLQAEYVWDQLRQATLGCNSVAQMFDAIRTKMAQITKYSDDTYFKPAFKEGDPVLVRNNSSCHWVGKRFHAKSDIKGSGYPYQASDGSKWTHCIEFDIDKMGTI